MLLLLSSLPSILHNTQDGHDALPFFVPVLCFLPRNKLWLSQAYSRHFNWSEVKEYKQNKTKKRTVERKVKESGGQKKNKKKGKLRGIFEPNDDFQVAEYIVVLFRELKRCSMK